MGVTSLLNSRRFTAAELGINANGAFMAYESPPIDAANSLDSLEVTLTYESIERQGRYSNSNARLVLLEEAGAGLFVPFYTQPEAFVNPDDGRHYRFVISPSVNNPDPSQPNRMELGGGEVLRRFTDYGHLPDVIKMRIIVEENGFGSGNDFDAVTTSLSYKTYSSS